MATFLPTKGKNESTNYGDLQALSAGIKANMELFELGAREGLTANEAYNKYGKEVLSKYEIDVSENKGKNGETIRMKSPSGKIYEWKVGDKEIEEAKKNGFEPI